VFLVYHDSLSSNHNLSFQLDLLQSAADISHLLGYLNYLVFMKACLLGKHAHGHSFRCDSLSCSYSLMCLLPYLVGIFEKGLLLLDRSGFYYFVWDYLKFLSFEFIALIDMRKSLFRLSFYLLFISWKSIYFGLVLGCIHFIVPVSNF
jgi:hypothetical protein